MWNALKPTKTFFVCKIKYIQNILYLKVYCKIADSLLILVMPEVLKSQESRHGHMWLLSDDLNICCENHETRNIKTMKLLSDNSWEP